MLRSGIVNVVVTPGPAPKLYVWPKIETLPFNLVLLLIRSISSMSEPISVSIDDISLALSTASFFCTERVRALCKILPTASRAPSAVWTKELAFCRFRID